MRGVNSRLLPDGIAPSGARQVGGSEPEASGCGTTPHRPRLGAQGFARSFARTTRGGESWAPVKGRHALSIARLLESWTPEHLRRVTRRKPFARGARGVRGAHAKFPLKTEAAIRQFSLRPTVRGARIPSVSRCFTLVQSVREKRNARPFIPIGRRNDRLNQEVARSMPCCACREEPLVAIPTCIARDFTEHFTELFTASVFCSFDSAPIFGAFVHSAIQPPNESGSIFLSSSRRVLSTCRSESNEPTRRANCSQWGMSTERITRLMSGI